MRPLRAALRWGLRLLAVAVVVGSLALNAAMATLAPVATAAAGLAQRLLGVSAIETVLDGRTAGLRKRVDTLQTKTTDLEARNRRLLRRATNLEDDLAEQGRRVRRLRREIDGPSKRIARRVFRSTARNVGSVGVELIPIAGGLAAIVLTAFEVRDSCVIMDDMNALRGAAGFEPMADDWFSRTCNRLPLGLSGGLSEMTVPACRERAAKAEAAMLEGTDTLLTDPPEGLQREAERMRAGIEEFCDCLVLNPGDGDACVASLGAAR